MLCYLQLQAMKYVLENKNRWSINNGEIFTLKGYLKVQYSSSKATILLYYFYIKVKTRLILARGKQYIDSRRGKDHE